MFQTRLKGHHQPNKGVRKMPVSKEEIENFLQTKPQEKEGVIYFHVPYCDKICSFCSMNRTKLDNELQDYTNFLLSQIKKFSSYPYIKQKSFESIYFGGGTPTILKEKQLELVLKAINSSFNVSKTCEFNFESTLHNLSLEKVKLMQSLGVNRYSIGIQTFDDKGRILLNRTGDKNQAIEKLQKIKDNFDGLVCIDIIYNYPNQNVKEVLEDARISKMLKVDSASFYSLMFHEGSNLSKEISQDYYNIQTDKKIHDAFLNSMLEDEYEILEYTKISRKNKDKYKYIKLSHIGADILPLGVGAGGRLGIYDSFVMSKDMRFFTKSSEKERALRRVSTLFQYPIIQLSKLKKLVDEQKYNEILAFLKKAQSYQYLSINDTTIEFKNEGIFWGNTIAKEICEIASKE